MFIEKNLNYMGLYVDNGSGSGIFPDPGDPKRPDPTGSGSATQVISINDRQEKNCLEEMFYLF